MKQLKDILYKVGIDAVSGSTERQIKQITFDSRKVKKGSLFIAIKGSLVDGHDYISKAIKNKAVAIICEELPKTLAPEITYVQVRNSADATGIIASNFYDHPSQKLKLIGVTGTNGKTSVVTLLFRLLSLLGEKCGMISTVQYQIEDTIIPATHTTPDAISINEMLAEMVHRGCNYCFMEVSSHAIEQKRVNALNFHIGVFTNITHDHLDYHKTFKEYLRVKKVLFDKLPVDSMALYNIDDKNGKVVIQNTSASKFSYGLHKPADFKAKVLENTFDGLFMSIDNKEFYSRLIGTFNAYNLLAVYGCALLLGFEKIEVLKVLSGLQSAEGRFDYIVSMEDKIIGIVDYAHTPDALEKVLDSIKQIKTGQELIISVVGCGGDRDKRKRPIMAKVACELSDKVIFTSDNPRNEDPATIIKEMEKGISAIGRKKVLSIVDRKEAIRTACSLAQKGDIILVAGKGHEKYQEIKGKKFAFDDKEILGESLKELHK